MTATGDGDQTRDSGVVTLTVPAALEYVRLVRLTTSGYATRLGFDVEELDDLRVAIDELASAVIDAAAGDLEVTFSTSGQMLCIRGTAPTAAGADVTVDELTSQILKVVIDDYDIGMHDTAVRFSCTRRLPRA